MFARATTAAAAAVLLIASGTGCSSESSDAVAWGGSQPNSTAAEDDRSADRTSDSWVPSSDEPDFEDEEFTMTASLPGDGGCSNTTADLAGDEVIVNEDNELGFLDSVDIWLRTCPTETDVRFDAGPIAEVDGVQDADGCLDALADPAGLGQIPLTELEPGLTVCIGHRYMMTVSLLRVVEVDVATNTIVWSATNWSRLDIPSW